MTPKEREEQAKSAYSNVSKTSMHKWVESFLKDLKLAYKP